MANSSESSVSSKGKVVVADGSGFPSFVQLNSQIISVKLDQTNYLVWKQQIETAVRGYGLEAYLYGSNIIPEKLIKNSETQKFELNQEYLEWQRQDQFLAAWLMSTLTEGIMTLMVGLTTANEIWKALASNFATQSRAKIMQHKLQLQTLKKGSLSMIDYLNRMRTSFDTLASVGYILPEEDKVMHVLTGLGSEYDAVVVTITSKFDSWSLMDVQALLLSYEARIEANTSSLINSEGSSPSVNTAYQSNGSNRSNTPNSPRGGRGGYGGRRGRGGRFGGNRGRGQRSGGARFQCQLCTGNHTADRCWYRFDANFPGPNPPPNNNNNGGNHHFQRNPALNMAQMNMYPQADALSEGGSWYPDSGATHHVSNDLANLNLANDYNGFNRVQMGNGSGPNHQGGSTSREA